MELLTALLSVLCGLVAMVFGVFMKYPWLWIDIKHLYFILPKAKIVKKLMKEKELFVDAFEKQARENPERVFLMCEGQEYTYGFVNVQCNKVAHMAMSQGWKCGDIVAIWFYNGPEFIWTLLGLQKAGISVALLNTNLRSKSLLHCMEILPSVKAIIVSKDVTLCEAIDEVYQSFSGPDKPTVFLHGDPDTQINNYNQDFVMYDPLFTEASGEEIDSSLRKDVKMEDPLCYIYTSGTTGLPKAAIVSHNKRLKAIVLMLLCEIRSTDRVYTCMPLYHSAALLGLVGVVQEGACMVIKKKFSASQFWPDCRKYDVTIIQYIGELCRYVMAQPKSDLDRQHKVRTATGNGLRKDIFAEFQTRFGIKNFVEFYGATEGNAFLMNIFNIPGCIGRITPFLSLLSNVYLVKYDLETVEPIRDSNGRCIKVKQGEKGLMITKIKVNQEFEGYVGKKELTEKKQVKNIFQEGDAYFNTGDILVQDKNYFVYFSDRIGDTFRWKAENVSTIEVGNVITDLEWVEDANVYGVEVPGYDGRCGMASLTLTPNNPPVSNGTTSNQVKNTDAMTNEQLRELYAHCEAILPAYARPQFIRTEKEAIITGTFKQQKVALIEEGFHPEKCEGATGLYCINPPYKTYMPLDFEMYEKIVQGQIRL